MGTEKEAYEKKKKASKKARAKSEPGSPFSYAKFVIEVEDGGRLVADDDTSKQIAVYKIDDRNIITSVSDQELLLKINLHFPGVEQKNRNETLGFLKLQLAQQAKFTVKSVPPTAFLDEPDQVTWNRLPLKKSDLEAIDLGKDLPEFANLLKFCDDPRALILFIGSLLDPQSARSTYLHLHGAGGNGKSRLFEGIEAVLGNRFVVRTSSEIFRGSFFGEECEGARLLLFAEDNNPGFFSSSKFKEFTGEQFVTVSAKYQKPRKIRLSHKTVVISNNPVEISSSIADRRRLLSVSVSVDPQANYRHTWWYQGMFDSAIKIISYCYSEYCAALAIDPTIRAGIPQSEVATEAAVARKYAEITDAILRCYTITDDVNAKAIRRADVHAEIAQALGGQQLNRFFMQQMKEALSQLGVKEGSSHGNIAVYRRLKKGGVSLDKPETPGDITKQNAAQGASHDVA